MKILWVEYGKPFVGYTLEDYIRIVEEVAGEKLDWYWEECIFGNHHLEARLNEMLAFVGLQMTIFSNGNIQLNVHDDFKAKVQRDKWLASVQESDDEEEEGEGEEE